MSDNAVTCEECSGRTLEFRGHGLDLQYRVCSRWRAPGHLTEQEMREKLAAERLRLRPSGRFA